MQLKLYITRHAKAVSDDFFYGDFYRPLNKTGYAEAAEMALWLSSKENKPDLIITSPAIRAYSTSLIFAQHFAYPAEAVALKEAIYNASLNALYRTIRETGDSCRSLAIFGHNPGLSELFFDLCDAVTEQLPTCGIGTLTLNCNSWNEIKSGCGKFEFIKVP